VLYARRQFDTVATYCFSFSKLVPVSFVLGFYVTQVWLRFVMFLSRMPWPTNMAVYVASYIHGNDDRGRLLRRTIIRHLCLALIVTMTAVSSQVKKRFPSLDHLREAGLSTTIELSCQTPPKRQTDIRHESNLVHFSLKM